MMRNKKLWLVGGVFLGLLFVGGGVFLWQRQRKPAEISQEAPPERKLLVTPPPAEEMSYETFTTEDGNFSLEYPQAWIQTEIKNLETALPKNFIDKYGLTIPLLLSDPRGAQTSLSIYHFEEGMGLEAVMDALKADLVSLGQPYNEVSRKKVGDSLVVDSTVNTQGVTVKVRDVLFLAPGLPKNIVYGLSFTAREDSWGEYEAVFNHVQTSARLSR